MRVQSTGFGVRLQSSEFRVQGSGFRRQFRSEVGKRDIDCRANGIASLPGRVLLATLFSTDMLSLTGRSFRAEVEKGERFRCSVFGVRLQGSEYRTDYWRLRSGV